MDWGDCPNKFWIWGGVDLDPASWSGLELVLKIWPVKTSSARSPSALELRDVKKRKGRASTQARREDEFSERVKKLFDIGTRSTATSRCCWYLRLHGSDNGSLLRSLAGFGAGPVPTYLNILISMGKRTMSLGQIEFSNRSKFQIVNVVRFENKLTSGVFFSTIGTIFRDWSWNFPTSNFKGHPNEAKNKKISGAVPLPLGPTYPCSTRCSEGFFR